MGTAGPSTCFSSSLPFAPSCPTCPQARRALQRAALRAQPALRLALRLVRGGGLRPPALAAGTQLIHWPQAGRHVARLGAASERRAAQKRAAALALAQRPLASHPLIHAPQIATVLVYLSDVEDGGETSFLLEGRGGLERLRTIDYKACDTGIKARGWNRSAWEGEEGLGGLSRRATARGSHGFPPARPRATPPAGQAAPGRRAALLEHPRQRCARPWGASLVGCCSGGSRRRPDGRRSGEREAGWLRATRLLSRVSTPLRAPPAGVPAQARSTSTACTAAARWWAAPSGELARRRAASSCVPCRASAWPEGGAHRRSCRPPPPRCPPRSRSRSQGHDQVDSKQVLWRAVLNLRLLACAVGTVT